MSGLVLYALRLPYLCRKERLYLMNHDAFLQDVYSVVAAIPAGRVVTYGQIAYLVGNLSVSQTSVFAYGGTGDAQRAGRFAPALP